MQAAGGCRAHGEDEGHFEGWEGGGEVDIAAKAWGAAFVCSASADDVG